MSSKLLNNILLFQFRLKNSILTFNSFLINAASCHLFCVLCVVRRCDDANESHGTVQQEFGANPRFFISFWLTVYLFYLSDLFEILTCPFPMVISQPMLFLILSHAPSLTRLICFSLSIFLSPPSNPHSFFTCLCLIGKRNWFVWWALLNKCIWTNFVTHYVFAHNNCVSIIQY